MWISRVHQGTHTHTHTDPCTGKHTWKVNFSNVSSFGMKVQFRKSKQMSLVLLTWLHWHLTVSHRIMAFAESFIGSTKWHLKFCNVYSLIFSQQFRFIYQCVFPVYPYFKFFLSRWTQSKFINCIVLFLYRVINLKWSKSNFHSFL